MNGYYDDDEKSSRGAPSEKTYVCDIDGCGKTVNIKGKNLHNRFYHKTKPEKPAVSEIEPEKEPEKSLSDLPDDKDTNFILKVVLALVGVGFFIFIAGRVFVNKLSGGSAPPVVAPPVVAQKVEEPNFWGRLH
jgi:hypothetical protein